MAIKHQEQAAAAAANDSAFRNTTPTETASRLLKFQSTSSFFFDLISATWDPPPDVGNPTVAGQAKASPRCPDLPDLKVSRASSALHDFTIHCIKPRRAHHLIRSCHATHHHFAFHCATNGGTAPHFRSSTLRHQHGTTVHHETRNHQTSHHHAAHHHNTSRNASYHGAFFVTCHIIRRLYSTS